MEYKLDRKRHSAHVSPPSEADIMLWLRPSIPAWLDDMNLLPSEFRVFCHVLRRGSGMKGHGCCTESIPHMATKCRLGKNTVRRSLQKLVKLRLLTCKERNRKTNIYSVVPSWKEWKYGKHPTMES